MQINPSEETSIKLMGDWSSNEAEILSNAWFAAIAMEHKLPPEIRYMEGMSGKKYRYLINNLVGSIDNARYLEIGSWKGSTACSAIYGNHCRSLCIDNWNHFLWGASKESVKGVFESNIKWQTMTDSMLSRSIHKISEYVTNPELEDCFEIKRSGKYRDYFKIIYTETDNFENILDLKLLVSRA
jgi:hypothetical protein